MSCWVIVIFRRKSLLNNNICEQHLVMLFVVYLCWNKIIYILTRELLLFSQSHLSCHYSILIICKMSSLLWTTLLQCIVIYKMAAAGNHQPTRVKIMGHSFISRLQSFLQWTQDIFNNLNLSEDQCTISYSGNPGGTVPVINPQFR